MHCGGIHYRPYLSSFVQMSYGHKVAIVLGGLVCMSSAEMGILGGRIGGEFRPQMMVLGRFG